MPALAPAWAAVSAWWAAGGLSVAAVKLAAVVGLSYATSKIQANQLAKDQRFAGRDINIRSAKEPEMVVYGTSWVAGPLIYANQRHAPASKDNFEMYIAVVHAAHEVDDIIDVMYDNDTVTDASHINWSTGNVESGKYGVTRGGVYAVTIEKKLGTSTQTASSLLNGAFPSDWTSNHRARGRAYTVHKFTFFSSTTANPDALFYSGIPSTIRARVKGKKVYQATLDSTNGGSGSHRFATPSTWEWSENPIDIWCDYLTQYLRVPFDRIDWAWVIDQAAICDELVDIPSGGTQKRFTCNGVISLGATHAVNREAILSSCMGTCPKVNGKWRPTAGAYVTPDVTLTEADIVGDIVMTGSLSRTDRYNTVRGTYISPTDYAQEVDFLEVTASAYVTRDNGEILTKVLSLPMTNHEYQAQRIAYKQLLQSDQMIACEVPLRWTGLRLTPGTTCELTYAPFGWSSKVFRCTAWKLGDEGAPVRAVLREDADAAWSDPDAGDYSTRDALGVVTLGTISLPNPTAGAPNEYPYIETFADNNLGRVQSQWVVTTGNGEESIVAETGTPPEMGGQYVWQLGNNSGGDGVVRYLVKERAYPVERNVLYRITFHVRRAAGSGTWYLGVVQLQNDRDTANADQWYAGENFNPGDSAWHTRVGYFINDGVTAANDQGGNTSQAALGYLDPSTAFIAPYFVANHNNAAGTSQIAYISIERLGGIGDGVLNSEVVAGVGGSFTWAADSSGAYPAGNPTQDLVASFYRNGSVIATHTVRATLTSSTGNIAIASQATSGEATTYAESGDGSQLAVATITHTASNQMATVSFSSTNVAFSSFPGGGGGGSGK